MTDEYEFPMYMMVVSVPASYFADIKWGMALLASQLRDSFFEAKSNSVGPCLALVNRGHSPAHILAPEVPVVEEDYNGNYALTLVISEQSHEEVRWALLGILEQTELETTDFVGGIITMEESSNRSSGECLFQVIQVGDWIQCRVHPFRRGKLGKPIAIGSPIVDENESGKVDIAAIFDELDN